MENRFRLGGIGESKLIYMNLYPNRWILVNNIKISAGGDTLRYMQNAKIADMLWLSQVFENINIADTLEMQFWKGRAIADSAVNALYGSSEIIFRYSSSGKAGSVSVLTAPPDDTVRTIFTTVSGFGASTINIRSYRPIVR